MPDCAFYAKARQGFPCLIRRWQRTADTTDERARVVLSDTARLLGFLNESTPPLTAPLSTFSLPQAQPPLWLLKAVVFLLAQMPARPAPESDEEAAAWAYIWLRIRPAASLEEVRTRCPAHLKAALSPWLAAGWDDLRAQRFL